MNPRLFSQTGDFSLVDTLKENDTEATKAKVAAFIEKNKGTEQAILLSALTEENARKAVESYTQLYTKFPQSQNAELAFYRIGQYYYSRGLYVSARKQFLKLIEKFPESLLVDDAMYLAASSLCAARKYSSCHAELSNFLEQYPRSIYRKLIKQDLKEIQSSSNQPLLASKAPMTITEGNYILQIGVFKNEANALKLKSYFSKLGFPTEIRQKNDNRRILFQVVLGSFQTEGEARAFGERIKKDYGKPYRIVNP